MNTSDAYPYVINCAYMLVGSFSFMLICIGISYIMHECWLLFTSNTTEDTD